MISGVLLHHFGFKDTFYAFAGLATIGALIFTSLVPETKDRQRRVLPHLPHAISPVRIADSQCSVKARRSDAHPSNALTPNS